MPAIPNIVNKSSAQNPLADISYNNRSRIDPYYTKSTIKYNVG